MLLLKGLQARCGLETILGFGRPDNKYSELMNIALKNVVKALKFGKIRIKVQLEFNFLLHFCTFV